MSSAHIAPITAASVGSGAFDATSRVHHGDDPNPLARSAPRRIDSDSPLEMTSNPAIWHPVGCFGVRGAV